MKKVAIAAATLMLLVGAASAQENEAGNRKVNFWIEFHYGVGVLDGSKGFTNHMQTHHPTIDYRSTYTSPIQIGEGFGIEYRQVTLGLKIEGMAGSMNSVENQFCKKEDYLYHMDLGYRFKLGLGLTLEPTAGFGVGLSDIYLATSRGGTDYVNSFSTANYIVPLVLNLTAGKNGTEYGIYVQYIICAGQIGKAHITGLATEVDDLYFQPTMLSFGAKCRF